MGGRVSMLCMIPLAFVPCMLLLASTPGMILLEAAPCVLPLSMELEELEAVSISTYDTSG
jgi:hypothetical protein